jgi:hypothetical protein
VIGVTGATGLSPSAIQGRTPLANHWRFGLAGPTGPTGDDSHNFGQGDRFGHGFGSSIGSHQVLGGVETVGTRFIDGGQGWSDPFNAGHDNSTRGDFTQTAFSGDSQVTTDLTNVGNVVASLQQDGNQSAGGSGQDTHHQGFGGAAGHLDGNTQGSPHHPILPHE